MPTFCAVVGCGTKGGQGTPMYRFPSKFDCKGRLDPLAAERLQKWCQAIKRDDLTAKIIRYERVCGKHFISGKKADLKDRQNPDWIPSVNMGHTSANLSKSFALDKYNRISQRKIRDKGVVQSPSEHNSNSETDEDEPVFGENLPHQQNIRNVEEELAEARGEIERLQLQLTRYKYNRENFEQDPVKCLYYTGLPNIIYVDVVYNLVEPYLSDHAHTALSKYERLILTLMKLRKDFDFIELGYKFDIHRTTASRIFYSCLFILYKRLKNFIIWPDRDTLRKNMPGEFKQVFGNKIAIIVDCFEIFIERPSTLQARSQTFSHYKHHNTIKILIGITPQGSISFVSSAYGGRCSDKFIVENSQLLENLLPGDAILADRGFSIDDTVKLYHAEVIVPAFLKGRKQLHPVEVEKTRKIAHLRINIERIIGDLRQKYEILHNKLSINLLNDDNEITTVDQMINVCCALVNLCPPIVN